jgi:TfoX/Sxy family transcriptional regulator of competence genes
LDTKPADLAARLRTALAAHRPVEQKMFGGTAFIVDGKMVASASKRGLLLRVGKDGQAAALKNPRAKAVKMGTRTMSGYVRVAEEGLTDRELARWMEIGLAAAREAAAEGSTAAKRTRKRTSTTAGRSKR